MQLKRCFQKPTAENSSYLRFIEGKMKTKIIRPIPQTHTLKFF